MNGVSCIALAVLILLLLPAVVMPWEGRRVPDALYAGIALAGLVTAGLQGGSGAIAWSLAGALAALALIAAIATTMRERHHVQLVTAGQVKLMVAGSLWLGPDGALAMLVGAFALLFIAAFVQQRRSHARRPDLTTIAALAILCTGIQQSLPDKAARVAQTANPER